MKHDLKSLRIGLASVLMSTLLLTAAATASPVAAASGCHLVNNIGWDQWNGVRTYYGTSFCTNPKTVNYVNLTVQPVGPDSYPLVMVWDVYITRNFSACQTGASTYIISHHFPNRGWQVNYGTSATYNWNIYAPVDFSGNPYVCIRYLSGSGRYLHSSVLPFGGY